MFDETARFQTVWPKKYFSSIYVSPCDAHYLWHALFACAVVIRSESKMLSKLWRHSMLINIHGIVDKNSLRIEYFRLKGHSNESLINENVTMSGKSPGWWSCVRHERGWGEIATLLITQCWLSSLVQVALRISFVIRLRLLWHGILIWGRVTPKYGPD